MPITQPVPSFENGLIRYLSRIRQFPMLELLEEQKLARRWREHEDLQAARELVTSHLRLVAKLAMAYRGYGLPVGDLISEGNLELMQAVKRFEPERGFRLSTYARWWIWASIQEYVLRSWSLVRSAQVRTSRSCSSTFVTPRAAFRLMRKATSSQRMSR